MPQVRDSRSLMDVIRGNPVRSALLATPVALIAAFCAVAQSWQSFTDKKIPDWFSQNLGWVLVKYTAWQLWLFAASIVAVYCLIVYFLFRPRRPRFGEPEYYELLSELSEKKRGSVPRQSVTLNAIAEAAFSRRAFFQPTSPVKEGFRIEALPPVPDLDNLTQNARYKSGEPIFTADGVVRVTNVLPNQGIDLVNFRLLRLAPPMSSSRGSWKPPTRDDILRRVEFTDDIPTNTTLTPGKTTDIRLFKATRPPAAQSLRDIHFAFYGKWPAGCLKGFQPSPRHLLVVEVTGNGVARAETTFELIFSDNQVQPVFTLTEVRRDDAVVTRPKLVLSEQRVLVSNGAISFSFVVVNVGAAAAKTTNFMFAVQNARLAVPPLVQNESTSQPIIERTNRRVTYSFKSIDPEPAYVAFHVSYTGEDGRTWDNDPVFLCWPGIKGGTIHSELNYLLDKDINKFTKYLRSHEIPRLLLQALNKAALQHSPIS